MPQIEQQLELFRQGAHPVNLIRPALVNDGIFQLSSDEISHYQSVYDSESASLSVVKFVPASGAATRMFKSLISLANSKKALNYETIEREPLSEDLQFLKEFIMGLKNRLFSFYPLLEKEVAAQRKNLSALLDKQDYQTILKVLLFTPGLNYSAMPKAFIPFHYYKNHLFTALEEHLQESTLFMNQPGNPIKIHFTISPAMIDEFTALTAELKDKYESNQIDFYITYSIQNPASDTIAVDKNNQIFRDEKGNPILRPAGHGALLLNLNRVLADLIFIKNIDNISTPVFHPVTKTWKKALAGLLLEIQKQAFLYVGKLREETLNADHYYEIEQFITNKCGYNFPNWYYTNSLDQKRMVLLEKLNRPFRVCGMVRNQGEPGGGPFWVENPDSSQSLQIIESAQINSQIKEQKAIMEAATHFNPVDLICAVKNHYNEKYDLNEFVDPNAYFISEKSIHGVPVKAMELPGLWNGAMYHWNTIFAEVPLETFNPVKTVNDLLRPGHQA